jgi:hypothetical protein
MVWFSCAWVGLALLQFCRGGFRDAVFSQTDDLFRSCLGCFKIHYSNLHGSANGTVPNGMVNLYHTLPLAKDIGITVSGDFAPGAFFGENGIF